MLRLPSTWTTGQRSQQGPPWSKAGTTRPTVVSLPILPRRGGGGAPPPRPARPRGGGRPAGGRPLPGGARRFTLQLDLRHVGTDDSFRDAGMDGHAADRGRQSRRRRPCCGGPGCGRSLPPSLENRRRRCLVQHRRPLLKLLALCLSLSRPCPHGSVETPVARGCAGAAGGALRAAPRQVSVRAPRGLHDELFCLTQRVHAAAEHLPPPPSSEPCESPRQSYRFGAVGPSGGYPPGPHHPRTHRVGTCVLRSILVTQPTRKARPPQGPGSTETKRGGAAVRWAAEEEPPPSALAPNPLRGGGGSDTDGSASAPRASLPPP